MQALLEHFNFETIATFLQRLEGKTLPLLYPYEAKLPPLLKEINY